MKVGENALAEFVDTLIFWEAEIVEKLRTNRAMNGLIASQQKEYDNATRCSICRHEFVEGEAKGHKVRDHDYITGWFSALPTASVTLSARFASRSQCFSITSVDTMHTLSSTSSKSDLTARSKISVRTWRSISRSSVGKHGISRLASIPVRFTKAACGLACHGRSRKLPKSERRSHGFVP